MGKLFSILRAVTLVIPIVEGLAYGVSKAYKEIRDAFRREDPPYFKEEK